MRARGVWHAENKIKKIINSRERERYNDAPWLMLPRTPRTYRPCCHRKSLHISVPLCYDGCQVPAKTCCRGKDGHYVDTSPSVFNNLERGGGGGNRAQPF